MIIFDSIGLHFLNKYIVGRGLSTLTEEELLSKAKKYLKRNYLETTVSMDTIKNNVDNGNGQLMRARGSTLNFSQKPPNLLK